uniref:interleukin-6 receptor subunit alpha isoform X1 n=1 Tax=Macaca mulatta TaxID=9544 RepID=UPI0010A21ADA|nr:interleukin-6 receptor subunit alpha isoform X1 [Macaca mulatta]
MPKPHPRPMKSESLEPRPRHWWVLGLPADSSGQPGYQALLYHRGKSHIASSRALQVCLSQRNPVHETKNQNKCPFLINRTGRKGSDGAGGPLFSPLRCGAVAGSHPLGRPVRGAVAPSAPAFVTAPWDGPETLQREFLKCFPVLPGPSAALSHVRVGSLTDTETGQRERSRARRGAEGLAVYIERRAPANGGCPRRLSQPARPPPRPCRPVPTSLSASAGPWSGSRGGSMLAVGCALLAALLAAPGAALAPGGCPAQEVARGVLTSLPGDSVTLTCPGGEPEDNATVHWVLRKPAVGSHLSRWAGVGRRLLLRSVQLHDSGNYSCYRAGRPAGTVHLLVDVPPEEPQLSCFRKSPLSNVVCEWGPRSTPSPTTKAVLLVRKFQNSPAEDFQEPCQYSQESQKFSCQLAVPEGDSSFYIVSMCVASSVGSKLSKTQTFQGCGILQPDPPANITVTAVARNPRWLSVTWQDPHSWNSSFYRLRFELRYRAERSKTFTTWMVKDLQHHCVIHDAWSGLRHVVQLRAQEEFGQGEWSEWSPEAMGTPWTETRFDYVTQAGLKLLASRDSPASVSQSAGITESRSPPAENEVSTPTQAPTTNKDDDNILSRDSANATSLPVQDSSSVPLPTFLVAGGSLAFGTLLCIAIVLRFKKTWKLRALKEGKTSMHPPYSLGQLVPERPRPTPVLVPLISPPVSPSSLGSDNTSSHNRPDARDPRSPYDISNTDYFFPR